MKTIIPSIQQHSNGPLEGLNSKIKAIKRAGFGY
ncbi:transposase [Pediococcus acidilactici]|nr:transposase [Pediococcus acidilactici]